MNQENKHPPPPKPGLSAFWAELKRRKVMRVAITYAVVAWLIIQVAETTFEGFGIPLWAFRFVMLCVIMGFPIAIILAWAFELTPEGIKTTKNADEERGDSPVSEIQQRKRNWTAYAVGAALPTVIFGALALFFYVRLGKVSHGDVEDKSIAVLPLTNMSPDPNNAFFADGVQEDILTNLSKIPDFLVISRSSTLQYRTPDRNLKQIGEALGARYLVEGSVRRADNQVLVTVQLIDSRTDAHLWAENYNRQLDDIFVIQAAIAKEIAGKLQTVLTPDIVAQIERRPTDNLEAYDYYVKARQLIESTGGKGDEKIALLEKAVALDPNFAEAWASLVTEAIYWWDYYSNRNDTELREKAHNALREAERTGSGLPHIHLARHTIAYREDRDLEASINHLLAAVTVDPNFRPAHSRLGTRYMGLGRMAEALHHLEISLRMEPLVPQTNGWLFAALTRHGLWDRAIELAEKNLQHTPTSYWKYRRIFVSYLRTGDRNTFAKSYESVAKNDVGENSAYHKLRSALLTRDYAMALEYLRDYELDFDLSFSRTSTTFGYKPQGVLKPLILFESGNKEESLKEVKDSAKYLETTIKNNPLAYPNYWSELVICYAILGDLEKMDEAKTKAREISSTLFHRYTWQASVELHIAIAYLVLGDEEQALKLLEAALELESFSFLKQDLDLWFIFDRLRGNPRFDALLEK